MPPEKYKKVYNNKRITIEKGIYYGSTRVFINGKCYYGIKLLNNEPEYLENLANNIIQIYKENTEDDYQKGYNDAKEELRDALKDILEIKE